MKFYKLATLFLLSFGIAFVVSCEEDTSYTKKDESSVIKPQIDFKISSADHLYHRNKTLKKTVDKIKTNMQKSTTSSLYNFGIYESRVQILEKNDYTQYTFEVFRDTILINQLENYVLKVYEDESIEQYLVKFDRQTEYTYDFISIQPIDDPDLNVTKTIGCTPELIDAYEEESCTGIVCTVFGHETGGNGCICGNDNTECPILYYECETTMVFVYDDNCDGGIDGGTTDPEGPPNGGGIDPTTGDPNSTSNDNLIIKPHTIASQEVKDFIETLPQDQQDWLNSLTDCDNTALAQTSNCNQELYGDIISFLNSNIENAQVTTEAQAIVSFIFQNLLIFIGNNNQDLIGSETLWSDDLSNNEEPKWGQLANKQEILNEINNIPNLNNLPFNMQLNSLISHFEKNLMYDRNDQTLELFIQNPQDRVRRYIYSQSGGWIDFHHVFKLFKWARFSP
ncbi:MAG: hypothetical protein KGY51_09880, partial [Psychroflexus sp.]|nr:hypothetical protein [Psychroflexus sp.]